MDTKRKYAVDRRRISCTLRLKSAVRHSVRLGVYILFEAYGNFILSRCKHMIRLVSSIRFSFPCRRSSFCFVIARSQQYFGTVEEEQSMLLFLQKIIYRCTSNHVIFSNDGGIG